MGSWNCRWFPFPLGQIDSSLSAVSINFNLAILHLLSHLDVVPFSNSRPIREWFKMCEDCIQPTCKEDTTQIISSIKFLRFFGPCVTFPERYGLLEKLLDVSTMNKVRPHLVVLSKLLLSVANGGLYSQDTSGKWDRYNNYVSQNHHQVLEWVRDLIVSKEDEISSF